MKVNLYMDILEGAGVPIGGFWAGENAGIKREGYKRLKISVDIPDSVLFGSVDLEIPVEKLKEIK